MDLSVVIVSYNTKDLLRECLDSLIRLNSSENSFKFVYEVIVVDNASTDGSSETIKEFAKKNSLQFVSGTGSFSGKKAGRVPPIRLNSHKPTIRLIENRTNLGFAKANNQGIKKAKGEYILLLNSDTVLEGNPFSKLVKFAKKHSRAGVIGCKLLNKDGSDQPSVAPLFTLPRVFLWLFTGDRFLYSSPQKARQVDWVMGAALMAKKEAIEKAGLLDEKFFMYMEEVEWCYRIKKAGWQVWFYPGAKIFHLVRGSSPEGKQRAVLGIYKGLIYFYQKHFAPWQLGVLKLLLRTKAGGAWLVGVLTNDHYLKETYAEAFKMAR